LNGILVISSSEKGRTLVGDLMRNAGYDGIALASCGAQARRQLAGSSYRLVIVNAPLSDEFGDALALQAAENSDTGVVLIVRHELADEISEKVEACGVMVLDKPFGREMFFRTIKLVEASLARMSRLRSQNQSLKIKIEEIRLVDRAKCALIQYLGLSEPQAHRYIEKQSMDLRITKTELAKRILQTYE
jgi:response regulator NasT